MFGDMMGQMEEMSAKMEEKLKGIEITETAADGMIKISVNGMREVLNVSISPDLVKDEGIEIVEDLLVVTLNRALESAAEQEAVEGQSMFQNMMPGGMDGLEGLM